MQLRALALCLALWLTDAIAAEGIILGFVTGNDYLGKFKDDERKVWLAGAMDGIMAEDLVVTKDPKGPWLGRCLEGVPITQVKAIFELDLQSRPDTWHAPAAVLLRHRLEKFCAIRS